MKTIIHKSDSRGHADHGWLNSKHSFSFAGYYNPERMNFGALRVLNDDTVAGGMGFGTHPHDNMEIISIPLSGDLKHRDSMGNEAVIKSGEIQVMSAGTGIAHSEYNKNEDTPVKFLQIWIIPNQQNVTPRYDQISLPQTQKNELVQILSPNRDDEGVWIHQNAWFHWGEFDQQERVKYQLKSPESGVYAFVIEGSFTIAGQQVESRDAVGVWDTQNLEIEASPGSRILLMEVPMFH